MRSSTSALIEVRGPEPMSRRADGPLVVPLGVEHASQADEALAGRKDADDNGSSSRSAHSDD